MRTLSAIALVIVELLRGVAVLAITLAVFAGATIGLVLVFLGGGGEQEMVPRLEGATATEGTELLEQRGLRFKAGAREYSASTGQDCVVRSKPAEGMRVKRGREVECVMSLGPRSVAVPALTDMTLAAAEGRLRAAGLEVAEIRRKASRRAADEVLEQKPGAGERVDRQQGVVLVASGGPDFGRLPAKEGPDWVFRRLAVTVPQGRPLQRVEVRLRKPSGDETVYDRVHRPGDKVSVNVTGRVGWRVRVSLSGEQVMDSSL
jgi:beta-lactam-binding protein with PASTA domain